MLKRLSTVVAGLSRVRKTDHTIPRLWVMTDAARLPDPTLIVRDLPAQSAIVVRHSDPQARRALAARLRPLCKARRIKLLISSDWRAAQSLNADGVHLPENSVRHTDAGLRLWRKNKRVIVSGAAHSAPALRKARDCDFVFVSPVFPTRSHPERAALGRLRFAIMARASKARVIALGGITFENVRALNDTNTAGIAGIGFATDSRRN